MLKEAEDVNLFESEYPSQKTCGNFATENDACEFFDRFMEGNKFFVVESEVKGRRLYDSQPLDPKANWQGLRIDRILHPTINAFQAGWGFGQIGVELKKSGIKIGGVIAQVIEHRTTVFMSKYLCNTRIMPIMFAVFPMEKLLNDVASFCAQHNILSCSYNKYSNCLKFTSPSRNCLEIYKDRITLHKDWKPCVRKGHRGAK